MLSKAKIAKTTASVPHNPSSCELGGLPRVHASAMKSESIRRAARNVCTDPP